MQEKEHKEYNYEVTAGEAEVTAPSPSSQIWMETLAEDEGELHLFYFMELYNSFLVLDFNVDFL